MHAPLVDVCDPVDRSAAATPTPRLFCRICLDGGASELVAPCQCRGTQQYVHVTCLRKWQSVAGKREGDERAHRCSVCRTLFSLPPPPAPRSWLRAGPFARGAAAAAIAALLVASTGPPWPHLLLAALLLLTTRSHAALAGGSLAAAAALATLHARGVRVSLRPGGGAAGWPSLALVRHGPPVAGLAPGALLVAATDLDTAGLFARAVVLVTEHSPARGARGVLLTRPLAPGDSGLDAGDLSSSSSSSSPFGLLRGGRGAGARLRHFVGGPVGMPGDGSTADVVVLHGVPAVPGARPLLPRAWRRGAADADARPDAAALLFEGGALADAVSAAAVAAAATPPPPPPRRGLALLRAGAAVPASGGTTRPSRLPAARPPPSRAPPSPTRPIVHVYHGVVAWAPGQLEGELRAGAWGLADAVAADVLATPADGLWSGLVAGPGAARVRWLGGKRAA